MSVSVKYVDYINRIADDKKGVDDLLWRMHLPYQGVSNLCKQVQNAYNCVIYSMPFNGFDIKEFSVEELEDFQSLIYSGFLVYDTVENNYNVKYKFSDPETSGSWYADDFKVAACVHEEFAELTLSCAAYGGALDLNGDCRCCASYCECGRNQGEICTDYEDETDYETADEGEE